MRSRRRRRAGPGSATLPLTAAHAASTWVVTIKASATTTDTGHKVTFTGKVRPLGAARGRRCCSRRGSPRASRGNDAEEGTIGRTGEVPGFRQAEHEHEALVPGRDARRRHAREGRQQAVKVTVYAWKSLTSLDAVNDDGMAFGAVDINGTTYDDSVFTFFSERPLDRVQPRPPV